MAADTDTPAQDEFGAAQFAERLEEREGKIREAAKWLVGSFAAVGAALIAGSQLSSIGKLPVCAETSTECARLWVAVGGAVASLLGVVWAIWTGVQLLAPTRLPLSELRKEWEKRAAVYKFFKENSAYWQGFKDFDDIESQEEAADRHHRQIEKQLKEAKERDRPDLEDELAHARETLNELYERSDAVVLMANHVYYTDFFRSRALRQLFLGGLAAALGIVAFAWAANPVPSGHPTNLSGANLSGTDLSEADLRDVDLREADLEGADLTGANLKGADLTGAVLDDVTWSGTTCPDGTTSDDAGGSCKSHL